MPRFRPLHHLLGRRGGALLLSGILWLFVAWGVASMPFPVGRPRAPHEYFPVEWRVIAWITTGAAAIICGLLWQKVWVDDDGRCVMDRIGFALLMIMPLERCLSWVAVLALRMDYVNSPIPLPPFGAALAGLSVWTIVCAFLWLINGWAEPQPQGVTGGAGR